MSYLYQLLRNRSLAEELTQETFLRAYRVRETYRPEAKFSTWLFSIARNAAVDQLRKKDEMLALDPDTSDPVAEASNETPDAEALLIERADAQRLDGCMESDLTLPQREALTLRTVSELGYEEIAEQLGVTLASVKSLIHRAKQALIDCLNGGGSRVG
jgi:RNA polymerase sigma-70 factor (ECF subfamily)